MSSECLFARLKTEGYLAPRSGGHARRGQARRTARCAGTKTAAQSTRTAQTLSSGRSREFTLIAIEIDGCWYSAPAVRPGPLRPVTRLPQDGLRQPIRACGTSAPDRASKCFADHKAFAACPTATSRGRFSRTRRRETLVASAVGIGRRPVPSAVEALPPPAERSFVSGKWKADRSRCLRCSRSRPFRRRYASVVEVKHGLRQRLCRSPFDRCMQHSSLIVGQLMVMSRVFGRNAWRTRRRDRTWPGRTRERRGPRNRCFQCLMNSAPPWCSTVELMDMVAGFVRPKLARLSLQLPPAGEDNSEARPSQHEPLHRLTRTLHAARVSVNDDENGRRVPKCARQ